MSQRDEIETSFLHVFMVNDLPRLAHPSSEDRREHIRSTIVNLRLKDLPFDANISYGEAYRICYLSSVVLEKVALKHGRH